MEDNPRDERYSLPQRLRLAPRELKALEGGGPTLLEGPGPNVGGAWRLTNQPTGRINSEASVPLRSHATTAHQRLTP